MNMHGVVRVFTSEVFQTSVAKPAGTEPSPSAAPNVAERGVLRQFMERLDSGLGHLGERVAPKSVSAVDVLRPMEEDDRDRFACFRFALNHSPCYGLNMVSCRGKCYDY